MTVLRKFGLALALLLGLMPLTGQAQGQFPDKPIRLVVPYAPGGLTDIMARTFQEPLSKALGQQVIIDNKPGAAGAIGTQQVARAAPDGYTLIFGNNGPAALVPLMQKDVGYDPIKDFAPVSLISLAPLVFVTHGSIPAQTLPAFIDYARKNPGKVEYASSGPGSLGHLSSELFAISSGLQLVHIPYKGSAPAAMAAVNGEVKMYLSTTTDALNASIKAGKSHLIGVSSPRESPLFPGVPPIGSTVPGFDVQVWFGILAPAGTPAPVVARLNAAIREALANPTVQERFVAYGCVATASAPGELGGMIESEIAKWRKIVAQANIKAE